MRFGAGIRSIRLRLKGFSSNAFAVMGLLLATVMVILLATQVHNLRAELQASSEREGRIDPGMYVPRLELQAPDGSSTVVGAPAEGRNEVLLIYNTTCPFCAATVSMWKELAQVGRTQGVPVYGLSLDNSAETSRFVAEHGLNYPSLLLEDERSRALLRVSAVPVTLVVNSDGRVLYARRGNLTEGAVDSVLVAAGSSVLDTWFQP